MMSALRTTRDRGLVLLALVRQNRAVPRRHWLPAAARARILDYALWLNEQISPLHSAEWAKGTPEDWAKESHDVAIDVVYKDVPADGDPPKLDSAYVHRAEPVVEVQLERAGVTLAEMLNRIFESP